MHRTPNTSVISKLVWKGEIKLHHKRQKAECDLQPAKKYFRAPTLSGPLDRLNAILSLLQPLDRYRTPSAMGSAIGRPLSRPISKHRWESSTASF